MPPINSAYLDDQLKRWMRPDAQHFVRPDWRCFVRPEFQQDHPFALYERKYSPEQPRDDHGRWTGGRSGTGRNDPRVVSDATPDAAWKPGAQYAQNRTRGSGSGPVMINGQLVEPTPAQAARLTVVEAQAQNAIRRVQELDPSWRPSPSVYGSVEGLISAHQANAQQALNRISELQGVGIGPGRYAGESIPARGPERDFTASERRDINRIGTETGCHTCGTGISGTPSENFVLDHQPPTAWNPLGSTQRLYPQCLSCSSKQGIWISRNGGRR